MNRALWLVSLSAVACYPKAEQDEHAQFDTKADDILAAVAALDAKVTDLAATVATLQTDLDGVGTDVATVQSTLDGLATDVATAQASLDGLETSVASVQTGVTGVSTAVASVDTKVVAVNTAVTAVRDQHGWRLIYDYDGDTSTVLSGSVDDVEAAIGGGADVRVAVEDGTDEWYTVACDMVYVDTAATAADRVTCVTTELPNTQFSGNSLRPRFAEYQFHLITSDGEWSQSFKEDVGGSWWSFDTFNDSPYHVRWYVNWNAQ